MLHLDRKTPRMKPAAGMLREALVGYGANPADTPFVGDQLDDLKAAFHAGCRRVLVRTGLGRKALEGGLPDTSGRSPSTMTWQRRSMPIWRDFRQPATRRWHCLKAMIDRTEEAERAACAMREDVMRVSRGRPCHWITVHEVASGWAFDDGTSEAAVQRAMEHGWFVADGNPPHSARHGCSALTA